MTEPDETNTREIDIARTAATSAREQEKLGSLRKRETEARLRRRNALFALVGWSITTAWFAWPWLADPRPIPETAWQLWIVVVLAAVWRLALANDAYNEASWACWYYSNADRFSLWLEGGRGSFGPGRRLIRRIERDLAIER